MNTKLKSKDYVYKNLNELADWYREIKDLDDFKAMKIKHILKKYVHKHFNEKSKGYDNIFKYGYENCYYVQGRYLTGYGGGGYMGCIEKGINLRIKELREFFNEEGRTEYE